MTEPKSKLDRLKDNRVPLTPAEHKQVMDSKAVWHSGPNGEAAPAVWKSKNARGDVTFVTNTHRAYNTAPTLKGAIGRFHKFIRSTA